MREMMTARKAFRVVEQLEQRQVVKDDGTCHPAVIWRCPAVPGDAGA